MQNWRLRCCVPLVPPHLLQQHQTRHDHASHSALEMSPSPPFVYKAFLQSNKEQRLQHGTQQSKANFVQFLASNREKRCNFQFQKKIAFQTYLTLPPPRNYYLDRLEASRLVTMCNPISSSLRYFWIVLNKNFYFSGGITSDCYGDENDCNKNCNPPS